MRFSSRPVSSPGRTENPPLLMRFLRTNAGSRSTRRSSRGRSRSRRPIFFRRKNAAAAETQEPSSPKVTCMGQVRINRSKKPKPGTSRVAGGRTEPRSRRCTFFCHPFSGKLKPTCFTPVWRKWKSFSQVSFSRKSEKRSSSSRSEPIFGRSTVEPEEIRRKEEPDEEASSHKSFTGATPPRNALLLIRSRSATYRSPSLANTLWEDEQSSDINEPRSRHEPQNVSESTARVTEETKRSVLDSPRRQQHLVLTRCNSEPSRIGEKLVPDNPRLGFT